ncbi:MAG: hypothetical protein JWN25_3191 [Verrucomicrobiales bacterium]|nr:hypothetical protein [Verrucomicrobiales bacterium]
MKRRKFLKIACQTTVGLGLVSSISCRTERGDHTRFGPPDASKPLISDLEFLIPKLMKEKIVPGVSLLLIEDGRPVWRRGFGVRDTLLKVPVDDTTVFEAQSMSKPVFAYAAMKLCERGRIDLDTPLTRYTTERRIKDDPRLDLITARHVLSHSTGFQNWASEKAPLKIDFAPGSEYRYSGEGYSYLQSIVAKLTGQPFEPFMAANILQPFRMADSGYFWNKKLKAKQARPHDAKGDPINKPDPTPVDVAKYGSAGGLFTTATDYAKFLIEAVHPKSDDPFRLNSKSFGEMIRPQIKLKDDPYNRSRGLGWELAPSKKGMVIQHGGDNPGVHSFAGYCVENQRGFVIMTNGDKGWEIILRLGENIRPFLEG